MTKAPGGQPGNTNAVVHGLRSPRIQQANRRKLRAKYRAEVLEVAPKISAPELRIGSDLLADLEQIQSYMDRNGGVITLRGQVRKSFDAKDRLMGRYENWCRRNGIGARYEPLTPDDPLGLADLLGGQR